MSRLALSGLACLLLSACGGDPASVGGIAAPTESVTDTAAEDPLLAGIPVSLDDIRLAPQHAIISNEELGEFDVHGVDAQTLEERLQATENNRTLAFSNFYNEADPRYLAVYYADLESQEYLRDLAALVKIQQGHFEPRRFYAYAELITSERAEGTITATYRVHFVPGGDGTESRSDINDPNTVVVEKTQDFIEVENGLRVVGS